MGETIERHTGPPEEGYRRTKWARRGETIGLEVLPELALQVEAVLGRS